MHSSRLFSFVLFLFGALAFCVSASPIVAAPAAELAVRAPAAVETSDIVARCSSGCTGNDLLSLLLELKVKIAVYVALLDGHTNPIKTCNDIAAIIKVYVGLIVNLGVLGSINADVLAQITVCLTAILSSIIGGCGKYGLLGGLLSGLLVEVVAILDGVLASLVGACCSCAPGLLDSLVNALLGVTWNLLGFLLTYSACGL